MGKLNVDVFSDLKDIFQISGNILGVIVYGKDKNKSAKLDLPYQYVQMQNVEKNIYEVWFTDETVEYKQYGNCVEGKSLHYCFRAVEENDSEGEHSENAEKAYRNILQEFDFNVFRVVRFWNYIPGINEYGEYDEHYKEFCVGRERAFYNFYKENGEVYPAATGIGSNGKDLCIVLLAVHIDASRYSIENPRQIPAYEYPTKFGISSPKFSRATFVQYKKNKILFVSGTASIIGSSSVYTGDVKKQLYTTIENVHLLFCKENLHRYSVLSNDNDMNLRYIKVYIKCWEDYQKIRAICERNFDKNKIIYMQSDVCRQELLVEIEGVWS